MFDVVYSSRFKKSYKRAKQLPGFKVEKFREVVTLLASDTALPASYKDHALTGNLRTFRECHLAPDILLIYQKEYDILTLTLVNIGKHSQLFD